MDVYTLTLVVLLIILAVVFLRQKKPSSPLLLIITQVEGEKSNTVGDELVTFRARFLQIYSLAIAADWLQVYYNTVL